MKTSELERLFDLLYSNNFTNDETEQLRGRVADRSCHSSSVPKCLRTKFSGLPIPSSLTINKRDYVDVSFS